MAREAARAAGGRRRERLTGAEAAEARADFLGKNSLSNKRIREFTLKFAGPLAQGVLDNLM